MAMHLHLLHTRGPTTLSGRIRKTILLEARHRNPHLADNDQRTIEDADEGQGVRGLSFPCNRAVLDLDDFDREQTSWLKVSEPVLRCICGSLLFPVLGFK